MIEVSNEYFDTTLVPKNATCCYKGCVNFITELPQDPNQLDIWSCTSTEEEYIFAGTAYYRLPKHSLNYYRFDDDRIQDYKVSELLDFIMNESTESDIKIACRREILRRQGEERNWQYSAAGEHPFATLHKNHSLHAIQKF